MHIALTGLAGRVFWSSCHNLLRSTPLPSMNRFLQCCHEIYAVPTYYNPTDQPQVPTISSLFPFTMLDVKKRHVMFLWGPLFLFILALTVFLAFQAGKQSALGASSHEVSSLRVAAVLGPDRLDPLPFYVPPAVSQFRKTAWTLSPVTDKVTAVSAGPNKHAHTYDALYRWAPLQLWLGLACTVSPSLPVAWF